MNTKLIFNEDGDIMSCLKKGQAVQQLREHMMWIMDRLPLDIYESHCATPDICFFDSKAGEVLGRRMLDEAAEWVKEHPYILPGPKPGKMHLHVAMAIQYLIEEGTEPLDLRIECAHERGVKLLGEMRMNDTHQTDLDLSNALVPRFAADHPEYLIKRPDGINPVALDYSYEEVRQHRLAILREIVEDHDADGLSLNFTRWGKYFERDFGRENAPIMTEFIGQIRNMLHEVAQKKGRDRLLLGARVLSTMDENFGAGLDVTAWFQRRYLDYAIVGEFNSAWPGIAVEPFVAAAKGTGCEILGMMNDMTGSTWSGPPEPEERGVARSPKRSGYNSMLMSPDEARAIAHNIYSWGATGIGLWNLPNNFNIFGHGEWGQFPEQIERMMDWMLEAADPERVRAGPRRYHFLPIYKRDLHGVKRNYKFMESWRSPLGSFKAPTLYFNEGMRGIRQVFPFRMADGRNGEKLKGTFQFRILHCKGDDTFRIDINGQEVPGDLIKRTFNDVPDMPETWAEVDLADCSPFKGDNELGIIWESEVDHGINVPFMEELDVTVEP